MGKRIESPIKRFAGAVELKDPLPYPLALKYEEAVRQMVEVRDGREAKDMTGAEVARMYAPIIPVLVESVEIWDLQNFPEHPSAETFPGTPRVAVLYLLGWLINAVTEIYNGDSVPNA